MRYWLKALERGRGQDRSAIHSSDMADMSDLRQLNGFNLTRMLPAARDSTVGMIALSLIELGIESLISFLRTIRLSASLHTLNHS